MHTNKLFYILLFEYSCKKIVLYKKYAELVNKEIKRAKNLLEKNTL